jgi:hypothetical protein
MDGQAFLLLGNRDIDIDLIVFFLPLQRKGIFASFDKDQIFLKHVQVKCLQERCPKSEGRPLPTFVFHH